MYILNGYQSEGTITHDKAGNPLPSPKHYDKFVLTCFADSWPDHIGLDDTTYFRFGQPTKVVNVPTSVMVDVLGIPFNLGENSRDVVRKYDFENKLTGAEFIPVYNEKGKVVNCSFSFPGVPDPVEVPKDALAQITIEDSNAAEQEKGKSKK